MNVGERMSDAIHYWERKRITYNAVLAILAFACWGRDIILSGPRDWLGAACVLLVLAVIANGLYCLAYPVDLAMQLTPFRGSWRRFRWLLFANGMVLACIAALWVMLQTGMA